MLYRSTNKKIKNKTFKEVLFDGLAPDGGLYMPESFPVISNDFLKELPKKSFIEIALEISKLFVDPVRNSSPTGPSGALSAGVISNGVKKEMPIGFQLIGKHFREADILGIGQFYEKLYNN